MSAPAEPNYGTNAEKSFLDQLAGSPNAVPLLSNYLRAVEKRAVWGAIDKNIVVEYARVLHCNALAKADAMRQVEQELG